MQRTPRCLSGSAAPPVLSPSLLSIVQFFRLFDWIWTLIEGECSNISCSVLYFLRTLRMFVSVSARLIAPHRRFVQISVAAINSIFPFALLSTVLSSLSFRLRVLFRPEPKCALRRVLSWRAVRCFQEPRGCFKLIAMYLCRTYSVSLYGLHHPSLDHLSAFR